MIWRVICLIHKWTGFPSQNSFKSVSPSSPIWNKGKRKKTNWNYKIELKAWASIYREGKDWENKKRNVGENRKQMGASMLAQFLVSARHRGHLSCCCWFISPSFSIVRALSLSLDPFLSSPDLVGVQWWYSNAHRVGIVEGKEGRFDTKYFFVFHPNMCTTCILVNRDWGFKMRNESWKEGPSLTRERGA